MKSVQKSLVNTVKKDNGQRKLKAITKTFATAVKEIDDPRTWEVDYPLAEILCTALVAVCCGGGPYYDFATFAEQQLRWLPRSKRRTLQEWKSITNQIVVNTNRYTQRNAKSVMLESCFVILLYNELYRQ